MKRPDKNVIGVDFGSDSVRAIVVRAATGEALSTAVSFYPRWKQGKYQWPEQAIFRQHPQDYLDSFTECVRDALGQLPEEERRKVSGIGIDTTGSTPVPVNSDGTPLALLEEFRENENAMFYLWKDHSAYKEAEEISKAFSEGSNVNYCKYMGAYSAEWYWAKILHGIRTDAKVREKAYAWVEHCDWMVGLLAGNTKPETMYHSACAAGYKALWNKEWGGLPEAELLKKIDPYLKTAGEHYGQAPRPATVCAGVICEEWRGLLGLPEGTIVSGSTFDAHAGAVGAGIDEKMLVCTIGTSAVDMVVMKTEELQNVNIGELTRFGGLAENAILPGYVGIETGQSAFGDLFAWFKRLLLWPIENTRDLIEEDTYQYIYEKSEKRMLSLLEKGAEMLPEEAAFPMALDWFNGRRYPDADDFQRGAISGLSLGTGAPEIYRALVFAAVGGLYRILCGLERVGVQIDRVKAVGGISGKSEYIMQMMADVTGREIVVPDVDQTCALGAAVYAAMGSGCYENIHEALRCMAAKEEKRFYPDEKKRDYYGKQYREYLRLAEKIGENGERT